MPNNREIALLIWFGLIFVWMLTRPSLRASFVNVLSVLLRRKILIPLGLMLAWITSELLIGYQLNLWRFDLTTDTALWIVTSALVLYFNVSNLPKPGYVSRLAAEVVGIATLVQFLVNLYPVSLLLELLLLPVLASLAMVQQLSASKAEYQALRRPLRAVLTSIGLALLVVSLTQLIGKWGQTDWFSVLQKFVLPIWLTAALLPFLFALSLWVNYEKLFAGINFANGGRGRWDAKLALLLTLHLRTRDVASFNWGEARKIVETSGFKPAREYVAAFRRNRRDAKQKEKAERKLLRRFAGSNAVDSEGRRRDRREFDQTIKALRSLAEYQEGWYSNSENRYSVEYVNLLNFTRHGLPSDSGIDVHVSEDGQVWYAARRTVTGWCFAIGANGSPSVNWEYDGPELPSGYPGHSAEWGTTPLQPGVSPNWSPPEA